jgi:hypothetical protein
MPFLVGSVDPGITAMGMAVIDLETRRLVRATPVSPFEIAKKECRDGGATGIAKASKKKAVAPRRKKRASPNDLIGINEVPRVAARLIRKDHPEYFMKKHGIQFVYIESQFDGRMKDLFMCMGASMCTLNVRTHFSSMRSIRAHYGISVASSLAKGKTSARAKRSASARDYKERKGLSEAMFEELIHKDDVALLKAIARKHWSSKPCASLKEREEKIEKCYGDLGEACMHALYPGNWAPLLRKAYMGVEEAPDDMTEAKLAKVPFEEFNELLPRSVIQGFREYYNQKRERLKKQRSSSSAQKTKSLSAV